MSESINVISFDLDDTLWPGLPTILRAEKLLYQWLSENVSAITDKYEIEQLREFRLQLAKDNPELCHDLSRLRVRSFECLAMELSLDEAWIMPAFDVFYQARQKVTLFDDVKPVLDELKKDYQLVSLTNGNADADKTGVGHWFDHSLNSASVGKMKSQPEIYQQAQQLASIDASQMAHIGDDPIQDVTGANAAGVYSIWLNRNDEKWPLQDNQPDAVISTLHELPALLNSLR